MPRIRDRRVRIALVVLLLALIGWALYQLGIHLWANRQYSLAEQALERCDFKEAGACLDRYLRLRPSDGAAHLLAAQTARRRGDFDDAERRLRLALEHGALREEVAIERHLRRVQAGNLADADELIILCSKKPRSPEAAIVLEAIIEGSLRVVQLPLAVWSTQQWLKYRTGDLEQARGFIWRGRLHDLSGDFREALVDYRRAVELAPDYVPARLAVADSLVREEPREASGALDWLHRRVGQEPEVRLLTARWRRSLGQPEEAGRILDELL